MKLFAVTGTLFVVLAGCAMRPQIEYNGMVHEGEATFYEDGRLGNCSFPPESRPELHGAMNHRDYAGSFACGTYVYVRRKDDPLKRSVTVFIDNQCPECSRGDIDLSPAAFARIAEYVEGRVEIKWNYAAAPAVNPLRYRWKEGSCKWWFQLLVLDHQYALENVEVRASAADWVSLERQEHNYWEARRGINKSEGPFTIRVTDVLGNVKIDRDVPLAPGEIVSGADASVDK